MAMPTDAKTLAVDAVWIDAYLFWRHALIHQCLFDERTTCDNAARFFMFLPLRLPDLASTSLDPIAPFRILFSYQLIRSYLRIRMPNALVQDYWHGVLLATTA
jgi:hypothetical protein